MVLAFGFNVQLGQKHCRHPLWLVNKWIHATGKRVQKTRLSFCLIGLAVLAALVLYFLP
jgi:hypothetical protein